VEVIDANREVFGVGPICRGLAGVRKVWRLVRRQAALGPTANGGGRRRSRHGGPVHGGAVDAPARAGRGSTRPQGRDHPAQRQGGAAAGPGRRRIVGWRTAASMPTELPLDALEMALWTRARAGHTDEHGRLDGLAHHPDAGSQYTAIRYAERLADAGALASIGSTGDSYDNAMAESVIGLYKTECVRRDGPFRTVDDLELATLSWVHWFNTDRLHSSLVYDTPIEYEQAYYRQINPRQHPQPGELTLH
jgi:transposase InsO family protein